MVTSDGPTRVDADTWAGAMADPVVMATETRAARVTMDLERAMRILADNARLASENAELRTRLRFLGVEGF
jgi:hypothetical protein